MEPFFKQLTINFVVLLSLFTGMHTHGMLQNIKDTDSILHDDYKYLSLVHGAIAWETGVIRRLYDFGQIFPTYKEDKQGRKIIENYAHPEQSSKLVRLIHALFYRVPGSTGEADFGVTTQLASEDLNVIMPLVAEIIVQCGQLQQLKEDFKRAVEYVQELILVIVDADWLGKLGTKVTRESLEQVVKDVKQKPWNQNAGEQFVSKCKLFAQLDFHEQQKQELAAHKKAAEQFFKLIQESTKNLKKLVKPVVFKSKEEIESFMVQALNESDPNNIDALYPEHMVETVLLAFVYKKYSAERTVLKEFYNALNVKLDSKALVFELDERWVQDNFASVTQAQALATIENIMAQKDLIQSIYKHFAEFVYNAFQIRAFPAPVGYATSTYEYAKDKRTREFVDCMDNSMRNFINLYAYDAILNKFSLEKLLTNMGIKAVHPALAQFLQNFDSVNIASSPEAHSAWVQVISNIPYATYIAMVDSVSGSGIRLSSGKGYITVPENERNNDLLGWLNKEGYTLVGNNQYGYELRASLKNIIIVLDYLLQLNLFFDAGGLSKEFMRSDFIKEYFPKLCAAVKADCFLSTKEGVRQDERDKGFDGLDYTENIIYMTFDLANIVCKFTTHSGHGELQFVTAMGSQGLNELLQKINNFSGQTSLSLLVTNALCKQEINLNLFKNNLNYLYINFFATPLENTDLLRDIITQTSSTVNADMSFKIKIYIKDLFMRLATRQPDEEEREDIKLKIISFLIQKMNGNDLIVGAGVLQEAVVVALKGITDEGWGVRRSALDLFKALFEKGQGCTEVISFARKGITDQEQSVRRFALDLLKALVEKGQGFTEAISVARKGSTDQYGGVRFTALNLFRALVEKGQGFPEALAAAARGITDQEKDVISQALLLFKALFEKGQGFTEAVAVAEKGIADQDGGVRHFALRLFKALVEKVPNETKRAIQNLLSDPNVILTDDEKRQLNELLAQ